MSTRKTSNFMRGIAEDHKVRYPDSWGLMTSLRNILLRQTNRVIHYKHWAEIEDGDYSCASVSYISACAESLAKLARNKIPAGSLFLLDEIMSFLAHVFTSETLKNGSDRAVCVQAIKDIAEKVLDGGGYIVGCEAGLNQAALDNFKELLPVGTPVIMVRNEYKVKANKPVTLYSSPSRLKEQMLHEHETGSKLIVPSDSATQIDTQMRQLFTGKDAFFISARNSNEKPAQELANDPGKFLIARSIGLFGYSPTLQIGSSVEDGDDGKQLFDAGVGFFNGVLDSGGAMQMIGRYRTFVPWHIYCPKTAQGISDDNLDIFCPDAIRKAKASNVDYVKELVGLADYLKQFDGQSLISILQRSAEGAYPVVNLIDKWQAIYQGMAAWDGLHLRGNLKQKLEQRGYSTKEDNEKPSPGIAQMMKDIKESSIEEDGLELAMTEVDETKTESDAREVLTTNGHSRGAILEAKKILLMSEFPSADFSDPAFCAEYVVRSKGKKISRLRTEWSVRNPEQAKALDRWHIKNKLKQAANLAIGVNVGDLRTYSAEADLMAKGAVADAIDVVGRSPYNNESPEVVRIADWARAKKTMLKKHASMKIEKDASNVELFNRLAKKLGYSPKVEKAEGKAGKDGRRYVLSDFNNPDRGHMLKALSDKFAAKLEQKGETLEGKTSGLSSDWGQKDLANRKAASTVQPIKSAADRISTLQPTLTPGGDWMWHEIENDFIQANTVGIIRSAWRQAESWGVLEDILSLWKKDGRHDWLMAKIDGLKALAEVG